jgi:hypothetical protein
MIPYHTSVMKRSRTWMNFLINGLAIEALRYDLHDHQVSETLIFVEGFVKDNALFLHWPKTLEELNRRITKPCPKFATVFCRRCGGTLNIDLTLLEPVVALALNFTG